MDKALLLMMAIIPIGAMAVIAASSVVPVPLLIMGMVLTLLTFAK